MKYQHSVFFENIQASDKAECRITDELEPVAIYPSNADPSGLSEVRFFTDDPLTEYEQESVIEGSVKSVLNCVNN